MARTRSDSGFALLEVIVSAAVLAVLALAVLSGIDGAAASSGREKARAVAVSLAESDQERLRALSVTSLANAAATSTHAVPDPAGATRIVDGVTYTIASTAEWVQNSTGADVSCTSTGGADYFHISSTVTSRIIGTRVPAVTIDSLSAPNVAYSSTRGSLAVQVLDAKGNPLVNKLVYVTGGTSPPSPTATNSLGCAVFEQIPADAAGTTYTVSLNTPGYIDPSNDQNPSQTATVTPGNLTLVNFTYDLAATVTTKVVTYAPGSTATTPGATIASQATKVTAVNAKATGTLFPSTQSGTDQGSYTTGNLFPFQNNYVFFTGTCHYNDPTDAANYNTLNTVSPNAALIASQQVIAPATGVNVFQPPVNYQLAGVDSKGNALASTVKVVLTPVPPSTDTCVQPKVTLGTVNTGTATAKKWMVARGTSASPLDAGVPFGKYTFCFQDTANTSATYTYKPTTYGTAKLAYYDNTTPPTGQPTLITSTLAKSDWVKGSAC